MFWMRIFFFFFHDTATTEIYTLSLHDALPIFHCARGGKDDVGQQVLVLQHVLLQYIRHGRHREVIGGGDFALTLRPEHAELRAVRNEGHRQARWVDDVARTVVAEDRVVLVFAADGEAARAAFLETDELLVAEVPAARPLVDVAADGPLIANLRRPDFSRRVPNRRVQLRDLRMLGEVDDLDRRSDPQTTVRRRRHRGIEAFDVDEPIGRVDVVLHPREQVLTAGDRQGDAIALERGHRVLLVRGIDVGEGLHSVPPAFSCTSAASTLCGCSGRLRIVAPVALRTAFAIADAVDTVGGSPMPMTPRSGMLLRTTSICGTSDMPARRYHSMFGLTICPVTRSRMRSSNIAKLMAAITPPSA